jgi:hypothetical protein
MNVINEAGEPAMNLFDQAIEAAAKAMCARAGDDWEVIQARIHRLDAA